jgi:YVTN family beta-propeller protein
VPIKSKIRNKCLIFVLALILIVEFTIPIYSASAQPWLSQKYRDKTSSIISQYSLMPNSNAIIDVYKTKTNDSGQYSKNDIYTKHGLTVGSLPRGVAVNPITNMIYVANYDSKSISVINGVTNRLVTDIPTGSTAARIAVNPNTNKIYVANCDPESSSAIDCSSVSVIDGRTTK